MDKEKLNDIVCESSSDYAVLNNAYNYIENLEQQCKKQKEVIDKVNKLINHYLKNTDESGSYVETNTRWKLIPEILKELLDILKEV